MTGLSGIGYFQYNIYTVDISAIVMALAILISVGILLDVNASGLGESDFPEHPEAYCILDEENPLCENVDICDDEGEITSEDQFCTGEAVRNLPYPPGGCPEGYHGIEDDETGQCYSDDIECPEGTIMKEFDRAEEHGCSEYKINCDLNEDHPLCNGEERTDGQWSANQAFCKLIGDLCDADGFIKPEDEYCKTD